MAGLRHRVRSFGGHTGYQVPHGGGPIIPRYASYGSETCDDAVGFYPNVTGFVLRRFHRDPGIISGDKEFFKVYRFDSVPYENQPYEDYVGEGVFYPLSDNGYATQVAADTSPTRASVSVPNLLLDSFPGVMRRVGDSLAKGRPVKRKGNSVAEANFGWDLLYRDVAALFKFGEQVEQRVDELNRVYSKGGLKRRRNVASTNATSTQEGIYVQSFYVAVRANRVTTTRSRKWVTMRWVPNSPNIPSSEGRLAQARLLVHGWSNAPARVWDALPWSWAIDYFAGIGDWLNANANSIGVVPTNICVCTTTETEVRDEILPTYPATFAVTAGRATSTMKMRVLGSITPTLAHVPLMGTKQLVTVAGIAANYGGGFSGI